MKHRRLLIYKLENLIYVYAKGNLDLAKIVLTSKQYNWYTGDFWQKFIYRCNASERIAVMKYTGVTSRNNFLETYEHDIDTPEKLINIIERTILPRLWF